MSFRLESHADITDRIDAAVWVRIDKQVADKVALLEGGESNVHYCIVHHRLGNPRTVYACHYKFLKLLEGVESNEQ